MGEKKQTFQISKPVLAWLYEANSTEGIGAMFGFNAETVRKKLKAFDIDTSRRPIYKTPSKKDLLQLYPKKTLVGVAEHYNVGQTLVHKWFQQYGIKGSKKQRQPRSAEARANMSAALLGKTYPDRLTGEFKGCPICDKDFYVSPARLRQSDTHYCSLECKGKSIRIEPYSKTCPQCDSIFERREGETAGNYHNRKYCSKECATLAAPPPTFFGSDNQNYKGDTARRKQPRGQQSTWRKKILARDQATCQHCNVSNVPVVAHHIMSWEDFPEQRYEIDNGITLCNPCHFKEHGWNISVSGIKSLVNARGIETRRWTGLCLWCDAFVVKQASDMRRDDGTYRNFAFCNKKCAMRAGGSVRKGMRKSAFKGLNISKVFEQWANDKETN